MLRVRTDGIFMSGAPDASTATPSAETPAASAAPAEAVSAQPAEAVAADAKPETTATDTKESAPADKAGADSGEETSLLSDESEGTDKTDAPGDEKPDGAPETYQFQAPEGVELDQQLVADATPLFKDLNLNNASAQKVVDHFASTVLPRVVEQIETQQTKARSDLIETWKTESRADPEFGGAKLAENLGNAKAFLKSIDPKGEVLELLEVTGLANHRAVIGALVRGAKSISEDSIVRPETTVPARPKSLAEALYEQEA